MYAVIQMIKKLLELAFPGPERCLLCGMDAGGTGKLLTVICCRCEEKFTFLTAICSHCGREWRDDMGGASNASVAAGECVCEDCRRWKSHDLVLSRSAVIYNQPVKELLSLYKFRGDRMLAPALASFLVYAWRQYYQPGALAVPDLITYIPVHESRLVERTFNQAEELAALLGAAVGMPVLGLLEKVKATEKQSRKRRKERMHALDYAFRYKHPGSENINECRILKKHDLCILLVDDVYTTGSTLNEAARVMKMGLPHAKIYGLTVAR